MMENTQNLAPNNLDAEEAVISCCLKAEDTTIYEDISQLLNQEDFYLYKHQLIFKSLTNLFDQKLPLDEIHLMEDLKKNNSLDEIGGVGELLRIQDRVETTMSSKYFADIVKEKARLRAMLRSYRIATEKIEREEDTSELIKEQVDENLSALTFVAEKPNDLKDSADQIKQEFKSMLEGSYETDAIKTGIPHLDDKLGSGGISAGEVVTLSAPTSCGKSALALNVALKCATASESPCAIFSLEMPQKQITKRMVQILAGVNIKQIQDKVISEDNMALVDNAIDRLHSLPVYTSHTVRSAKDLGNQLKKLVEKHGVKLAVIDYLQLIPFDSKRMGKAEGIADISHKIKQIALDLNIGILLLAQVNREGAKRESGLSLYDLKDSGDIENDADVVLLMYPKHGDFEDSKQVDKKGCYTELEYKLAKNREGERGTTGTFKFYHSIGRFY
jgi:replicative DNA helicase